MGSFEVILGYLNEFGDILTHLGYWGHFKSFEVIEMIVYLRSLETIEVI